MLFRPYEKVMVQHMWNNGAEPTGSGALWRYANSVLPPKENGADAISRASVIFAANRLVDHGVWDFHDATGKGGHHRKYFAKMDEEQMWTAIKQAVDEKFDKLLG